jgi:hypothetical protein
MQKLAIKLRWRCKPGAILRRYYQHAVRPDDKTTRRQDDKTTRRQDDKTTRRQDDTRRRNKEKAAMQASEGWGGEERLKRPQQEMQGTCEDARRRVRCSNYSWAKAKIKRLTRGYACTVRRSKRQGPNYSPKADELLTPFPS